MGKIGSFGPSCVGVWLELILVFIFRIFNAIIHNKINLIFILPFLPHRIKNKKATPDYASNVKTILIYVF